MQYCTKRRTGAMQSLNLPLTRGLAADCPQHYLVGFPSNSQYFMSTNLLYSRANETSLNVPSIFKSLTKFLSNNLTNTGIRYVPPITIAFSGLTICQTKSYINLSYKVFIYFGLFLNLNISKKNYKGFSFVPILDPPRFDAGISPVTYSTHFFSFFRICFRQSLNLPHSAAWHSVRIFPSLLAALSNATPQYFGFTGVFPYNVTIIGPYDSMFYIRVCIFKTSCCYVQLAFIQLFFWMCRSIHAHSRNIHCQGKN